MPSASTCNAIAVATFGGRFIRKCVAPIRVFSEPSGCSTVQVRSATLCHNQTSRRQQRRDGAPWERSVSARLFLLAASAILVPQPRSPLFSRRDISELGCLALEQAAIDATGSRRKGGMGALFDDVAVIEYQNPI